MIAHVPAVIQSQTHTQTVFVLLVITQGRMISPGGGDWSPPM